MARIFLQVYVALNIFIVVLNIIVNIFGENPTQLLSSDDWLIFIVGCGTLAICEVLEKER